MFRVCLNEAVDQYHSSCCDKFCINIMYLSYENDTHEKYFKNSMRMA